MLANELTFAANKSQDYTEGGWKKLMNDFEQYQQESDQQTKQNPKIK